MAVDVTFLPGTNSNNIDTNFNRVKDAFEEVVGRNGELPNHMNADLDLNSNDLLNVNVIDAQDINIEGVNLSDRLTEVVEAKDQTLEARDQTLIYRNQSQQAANRAEAEADRAESEADRSEDEADRSAAQADIVTAAGAAQVQLAANEADRAAGYVNDIVQEKEVPITATRNGIGSLTFPTDMGALGTFGFSSITDGIEGNDWGLRRVAVDPGHAGAVQDADGNWWEDQFWADITVRIPTDFPTLQAAIDAYSRTRMRQGARIVLLIEAGHALTHGWLTKDMNAGHFWIEAEDAEVALHPDFIGVPSPDDFGEGAGNADGTLCSGLNSKMPVLNCLVDLGKNANASNGFFVGVGAEAYFPPNSGVVNSNGGNLIVVSGRVSGRQAKFYGAGRDGLRSRITSTVSLPETDFDNCCQDGGNAAIFLSRGSVGYFNGATARNSGTTGLRIHRSFGSFEGIDASGAAGTGLFVDLGSMVHASACDFSGATRAVQVQRSYATIAGSDLSNSTNTPIFIRLGAIVDASSVTVDNPDNYIAGGSPNQITGNGIVMVEGAPNPLNGWGTFSLTGASNGKTMAASSVIDSSRNATSEQAHYRIYNGNGQVGGISTQGSGTLFNTTSDELLKDFIGEYDPYRAIEIIKADPVRDWHWREDYGGGYAVGWGAQTSHAVSPDLASPGGWFDPETNEPVDEGTEGAVYHPWGMDQSRRTPYLWAAVSHLIEEVEMLKAEMLQLKNTLEN